MIQTAAGIGMSLIAAEHFYSTLLSSPWTTEKFAETEEDKAKIRRLYMYSAVASLITAVILATIIKEVWPIIATMVLCLLYIWVYERSLEKKL
uniref:Uncharacterized protein n=1 Tax=viral metagenome TaxID=1070528 RepID=A0A6M3L2Z0_9ZZZZ